MVRPTELLKLKSVNTVAVCVPKKKVYQCKFKRGAASAVTGTFFVTLEGKLDSFWAVQ